MSMTYCAHVRAHPEDVFHKAYHDTQYGFPLKDDAALFGRLVLEINQAGLSWTTILKKQAAFHRAYHDFDVAKVAAYGEAERARLLADASIIRNRLKVDAAIENARRILALQTQHGSFGAWLDAQHPLEVMEWARRFKKAFVFTGGEIVKEFLLSTGYLQGAHDSDCPIQKQILKLRPAWNR